MSERIEHYDVVIAGGGMVGISLACVLAASTEAQSQRDATISPLNILLVDTFPLRVAESLQYHPSFDARSTALSLASIDIYQELGIWQRLSPHAEPIRAIQVSDRGHSGNSVMEASREGLKEFGCVVENQWLGAVLLQAVADYSSVTLCGGAGVDSVTPRAGKVEIAIKHNDAEQKSKRQQLTASLLVIADGAQSGLRQQLGMDADVSDYGQTAIVTNIQTQLPHQGVAFERFTEDGAVALLPLPDIDDARQRSALVWTLPNEKSVALIDESGQSDECQAGTSEVVRRELQSVFGARLGDIIRVGQCASYPLYLTVAKESVRSNIVLMGNAAHSLHPVAGQGFNLALRDVAALAEQLLQARAERRSIGALQTLQNYESAQSKDQYLTVNFSHQLIQLFGSHLLPVQAARSAGLLALDMLAPVKSDFVRRAAGVAGRRPRLGTMPEVRSE